jgi:hypothetical protein
MAASEELNQFVRDALSHGRSRSEVETVLRQAGWPAERVQRAMSAFAAIDFPVPVPRPRPSVSAREAFMYLLLFSTLYMAAYNLGSLLFDLINRAFPDPAATYQGYETYVRASIRWSASWLIVSFPVFLFLSWLTSRATHIDPTKRTSPIRRWLTYLTLFFAACALIGDVVTLIYNLLGGELTVRFVLKVLVVAAIAGTVFGYYLSDLRVDEREVAA